MTTSNLHPLIVEAGEQIASDMISAQVAKSMGGLGGGPTWAEYLTKPVDNFDLILKHISGDLSALEAIYIAMERAREHYNISK